MISEGEISSDDDDGVDDEVDDEDDPRDRKRGARELSATTDEVLDEEAGARVDEEPGKEEAR